LDLNRLEADVAAILPSVRPPAFQLQPMPDYVAHQEGVSRVGALSAEAVVRDYETAAKEIEAMGAELISAAKKCETMTAQVNSAIAYMQETAKAYREEAKKIFQRIEDCSMLTEDVRKTCEALRQKIESNNTA
jgi:L-rhamnose isomerase